MTEPGNASSAEPLADSGQLTARAQALLGERLKRRAAGEGPGAERIPRIARRDGRVPLSFAQERLWFLERLEPGGAAHVMPLVITLRGAFDLPAWRRAATEVVRRHEALRTVLREEADGPVGLVRPTQPVVLPLHDLSALPPAAREREARRLALLEGRRPFDLERGPLFRGAVVRLRPLEHYALLSLHHVVADGWSLRVLLAELARLYDGFTAGAARSVGGRPPAALPELPIQYADFAAWQRERLAGEVLERELAFWRERLAGAPVLDLPTDFPRPAVQSQRGAILPVALSPERSREIRRLGREAGASLFMTLLAGFQILLARYTGQDQVSVGTPVAGRVRVETEGLIGLFLNTLVLRTDLVADPTFAEALARVREVVLAAQSHQELPFEKLVQELQPERSLAHSPLFQVMFVLQNLAGAESALPGLSSTVLQADRGTALFDLTLSLSDDPHAVYGRLEYATDLFERGTMQRLAGHLETLLAAAAEAPQRRLSELSLLTPAERRQLLVDWNRTEASFPSETLPDLLAARAAERPEAVAVEQGSERLTYEELEVRANRLARSLEKLGVGPEVRVGLCLERSLDLVVALLGVLKAGGVYVPLDPAHPRARLALVLEDAAPPVLLTHESLRSLLPVGGAVVVCLDEERAAIAAESSDPFRSPAVPENLAYVLFTSGSTGRPKGVEVTHRGLVNFLVAMRREPGFAERDALLAVTTLSFDIAGLELYLPLLAGGRVTIASRETAADGRLLAAELTRCETTVLQATPATWRMLLEGGWAGDRGLRALCGGEALAEELAAKLLPRVGSLWNLYGPTETTIWSSAVEVRESEPVRVGPPLANTRFYVVDRSGQPQPVGVPGELLIGGDGLARGYLRRPGRTAERFVPDPFGGAGERLYRSGDLVRWRSDGRLEFLGRLDHQVKVRGFRIELGEVEAALAVQPGVERAAVVAKGDAADRRLVAYVVGDAEPARLREALHERLPEYMVPSVFVRLEALPLTPNGKVDRKALPEPEAATAPAAEHVPPRTLAEELLAEIWGEVLKRGEIGAHDNFFALGGHSLLAMRVVTRVYQAAGVDLPLRTVFEAPTLERFAHALERALLVAAGELAPDAPVQTAGPPGE
ncbi:MAG TPA: amino acid adenylation domain-containing protein [Thermoanaerobaculia bacterium]|nr:amino acid adenylation domain-containing protein [Thermoanaerobaculia bacterium]